MSPIMQIDGRFAARLLCISLILRSVAGVPTLPLRMLSTGNDVEIATGKRWDSPGYWRPGDLFRIRGGYKGRDIDRNRNGYRDRDQHVCSRGTLMVILGNGLAGLLRGFDTVKNTLFKTRAKQNPHLHLCNNHHPAIMDH